MLKTCCDAVGTFNDHGFNQIVKKFRSIIYHYANKYYLPGGETEDLYQWGLIGLYKAVMEYQENQPYSFDLIARINIKNTIKTAITMANRQKHLAMNSSLSLCYVNEQFKVNDSREYMDRLVVEKTAQDPLEIVIAQEAAHRIKNVIENRLSESERSVMLLYLKGYKQRHIAQKLNYQPKFVDNALQRARKKISHFACSK